MLKILGFFGFEDESWRFDPRRSTQLLLILLAAPRRPALRSPTEELGARSAALTE